MPRFLHLAAGVFCLLAAVDTFAADNKGKSPADELPLHIRRVTHFGERADWSHDGKRILFLAKTFGDLYKLALDGSGRTERLTFFNDYPGYKASNPVVSDDGRYIAFQLARSSEAAGVGHGILVFDLEMYEKTKAAPQAAESARQKDPTSTCIRPGLLRIEFDTAGRIRPKG